MIAIILTSILLTALTVGVPPRSTRCRHAAQRGPRQLHLAEAPVCGHVEHNGREYLVVRDENRVRVVSLAAVREGQLT